MNNPKHDDYRINAFIDDQLDQADSEEFTREMNSDPALRAQVCRLRELKASFKNAYADADSMSTSQAAQWRGASLKEVFRYGIAASFILAIGFGAGWFIRGADHAVASSLVSAQAQNQPYKVILHINESNEEKYSQVLATAEELISNYKKRGVQVEVIANAGGLNLLRTDTSPQAKRISQLIGKYENLHFIACATAMKRMAKQGIHVSLIDKTQIAPSAVEHIVMRIQQGWQYIKV